MNLQNVRQVKLRLVSFIICFQNISQSVEGEYTYLRVNFFHPGSTLGKETGTQYPNADMQFLKEM